MKTEVFTDHLGRKVRLTPERQKHVPEHPEIEEWVKNGRPTRARAAMAKKRPIRVWYDREGDFLEVLFERKPGYFRETSNEQVMEKVDQEGHVIGFHVLRASRVSRPLEVELAGVSAKR